MKAKRVSICFINLAKIFGGHEVMLMRWLGELCQQGGRPLLVIERFGPIPSKDIPAGCKIIRFNSWNRDGPLGLRKRLDAVRLVFLLLWLRLRWGVTAVVVAEGALMAQELATRAAKVSGNRTAVYCPLVDRFSHYGWEAAEQRFFARYVNLPDMWITPTAHQRDQFLDWSKSRRPVAVLPNTLPHKLTLNPKPSVKGKRIVFIGRLASHQKGLDFLADYVSANSDLFRKRLWTITLIGEGQDRADLEKRFGLQVNHDVVKFTGWLPIEDALALAHCVLLPSRFEGVPLVVMEATSVGVPVVATDLPGTRPFLSPDCLFPVGDMYAAFDCISRLFEEPELEKATLRYAQLQLQVHFSACAFSNAVRGLTVALHRGN